MLELRQYQQEALDSIFDYWNDGGDNPLIELATGTGKSLLQASLGQKLITDYQGMRILSVTHVQELIEQNYKELLGIWEWAPAGIYSAGLGRRESQMQFLFAGIQSVHAKARLIGHVDVVMVDEAHLIPRKADTMYGRFLGDLVAINPDLKIVGFTATPYRTDSGRLDEGEVRLFDQIIYKYGIADGVRDGFLAPLVSKGTDMGFNLGGVARRGGDFVQGALQAACDIDHLTTAAVSEIIAAGENRRSWLMFCAGVQHAHHVAEEFRRRGVECGVVTGETPAGERSRLIEAHKSGELKALANNAVLTTGYNNKILDLIGGLRATESAGLYTQIAGRGTRCNGSDIEASIRNGKANCLYLDFAGNCRTHGPVDLIVPKKPGEGKGEAPVKECPECRSLVPISVMHCPDCGYDFPKTDKPKHEATAAALPILSTAAPEWLNVSSRRFAYHDKIGGTPSVRAEFTCSWVVHKKWICPGHVGKAKNLADKFWRDHGGQTPMPSTPDEFLNRQTELRTTREIQVKPNGKYFEIVGIKAGDMPEPSNDNIPAIVYGRTSLSDDIPF